MRLIIGSTIRKRCLHTLLQQKQLNKPSSLIQRQHSSTFSFGKTFITYYTAVAAVSVFQLHYRATTTATALYARSKPQQLQYRPVIVRRIAAAATFWKPNTTRNTATTTRNMSLSPTILRDNGTITITPKTETDQSALIVIAHGLGDSAEGFVDVAEVRHQKH